jgi:hypothetical protein
MKRRNQLIFVVEVWKLCRDIRREVAVMLKFPRDEKQAVRSDDQNLRCQPLRKGMRSFHYQENIQFRRQSRGSLMVDGSSVDCEAKLGVPRCR